jgi:hypothetical protein
MKKQAVFIAILMSIVIILAGCSFSKPTTPPESSPTTSQTPSPAISSSVMTTSPVIVSSMPTSANPTNTTMFPTPSRLNKQYVQAPIIIDKTFDGREINANLVKFIGSVSSPRTSITVNNIQATVNADGSYYAYLDLAPGKNIIEIKAINDQTTISDQIFVIFLPPLLVLLGWPIGNPSDNSDYTKIPFKVNGKVSDPTARVEVNKKPVVVNADGTFFFESVLKVGHNSITALALRGDEREVAGVDAVVLEDGKINPIPPPGLGAGSSFADFGDISVMNPLIVKAGDITQVNIDVLCNKDISFTPPNDYFSANIVRQSKPHADNPRDSLPLPAGLTVNYVPSTYRLFPTIEYHTLMVVNAGPGLAPGEYYFLQHWDIGAARGNRYITISVIP